MSLRPVHRAIALAVAALLASAGVAAADTVRADGDAVTVGAQSTVDLGQVAPSALVTAQVAFELVCSNTTHPDAGQTITLTKGTTAAPSGGAVVSATSATVGPVPDAWTDDLGTCPSPAPVLAGGTSTVTLRAPATPNVGYIYTVTWTRALSPAGSDDPHALSGTATSMVFKLSVVTNQAPILTVPGDQTVEGDTVGGWTASYPGVSASDAEDDPDPTPVCSPAAGEVLPLGTTTVACSATDTGGRTASGSFHVTVVDTTPPALHDVPTDLALTTGDPAGAVLTYVAPTATDVVDPAPAVSCDPASGSLIPVGAMTVTCSTADASGNPAQATFQVEVDYVPPHVGSVTWWEPVGAGTEAFLVNGVRTLPVKATLAVDGEIRTQGDAALAITPCGGGTALVLPMTFGGGRWNAAIETASLAGACHTVAASIDGLAAGSFRLELRTAEPAARGRRASTR